MKSKSFILKFISIIAILAIISFILIGIYIQRQQRPEVSAITSNLSFRGVLISLPLSSGEDRYGESKWARNNDWFFDRNWWDIYLTSLEKDGYTAIVFWHSQPFPNVVKFKDFPEANEVPEEQLNTQIKQLKWIFKECHRHNLSTYIMFFNIYVSNNFAKANKINQRGVRSQLAVSYTTSAVEELLTSYDDLDGLIITLGEDMEGNPTTWFNEAILPGIQNSGKHPHVIIRYWVFPYEGDDIKNDFKKNVVPNYDNLWFQIKFNMEMVAGTSPDPAIEIWQQELGIPFIVLFYDSNTRGFLWAPPKFIHDVASNISEIPGCRGILVIDDVSHMDRNWVFNEAVNKYCNNSNEPYDENYWVNKFNERYGGGGQHVLNALESSGQILPEITAQFYYGTSRYKPQNGISVETMLSLHPSLLREDLISLWDYANGQSSAKNPLEVVTEIKQYGEYTDDEMERALAIATKNKDELKSFKTNTEVYKLLSQYYYEKTHAIYYALLYNETKDEYYIQKAQNHANKALIAYTNLATNYSTLLRVPWNRHLPSEEEELKDIVKTVKNIIPQVKSNKSSPMFINYIQQLTKLWNQKTPYLKF